MHAFGMGAGSRHTQTKSTSRTYSTQKELEHWFNPWTSDCEAAVLIRCLDQQHYEFKKKKKNLNTAVLNTTNLLRVQTRIIIKHVTRHIWFFFTFLMSIQKKNAVLSALQHTLKHTLTTWTGAAGHNNTAPPGPSPGNPPHPPPPSVCPVC